MLHHKKEFQGMNTQDGGAFIDTDMLAIATRIESIVGQGGLISGSMRNPERTESLEVEFRLKRPINSGALSIEVTLTSSPDKLYYLIPIDEGREFIVVDKKSRDRGTFIPTPKGV